MKLETQIQGKVQTDSVQFGLIQKRFSPIGQVRKVKTKYNDQRYNQHATQFAK